MNEFIDAQNEVAQRVRDIGRAIIRVERSLGDVDPAVYEEFESMKYDLKMCNYAFTNAFKNREVEHGIR